MATITDNPDSSHFEIHDGDTLAGFAAYELRDGEIAFLHTEIGDEFEGRGFGGQLARGAIEAARDRGLAVVPHCPFVRGWIAKHPEYIGLVPEDRRGEFGL